jgi:hypothetical protein
VENCTSCGEHYGKTSRRRRTGLADNPRRRPFGRTVGVICRDHVSLASSGEHNSLAADCGGANIDYSAACENHLHRGNLGDERSGFRMTRLEAQNSSLLRLGERNIEKRVRFFYITNLLTSRSSFDLVVSSRVAA